MTTRPDRAVGDDGGNSSPHRLLGREPSRDEFATLELLADGASLAQVADAVGIRHPGGKNGAFARALNTCVWIDDLLRRLGHGDMATTTMTADAIQAAAAELVRGHVQR